MIVSCSSCATKFNVPDAKVAGKRARMTCKKCGAPISIDGTHLAGGGHLTGGDHPAGGDLAGRNQGSSRDTGPRPRVAPSSRPKNEPQAASPKGLSPRWRVAEPSGKRQEMSLDVVAMRYSSGGFEPGTLVCRPGEDRWMPPYDFPEVMSKASPLDGSAQQQTFADETVALSSAESAALKRQAQPSSPSLLEDGASAPPAGAVVEKRAERKDSFFDGTDVEGAMASFDRITGAAPPQASPAPPLRSFGASAPPGVPAAPPLKKPQSLPPPPPNLPTTSSRPAPRSVTPPPIPASWSSPASSSSIPSMGAVHSPAPTGSRPPVSSHPVASQRPSSPPALVATAPPSVRPPGFPPAAPPPAAPPSPGPAAAHAAAHVAAPAAPPVPQYAAYGEVSSTRVFDTRPPPQSGAPSLQAVHPSAQGSSAPAARAGLSSPPPVTRFSTDSGLSRIEARPTGPSGMFVVFLTLVLLSGAVAGIYFFRPDLYFRGTEAIATLFGRDRSSVGRRVAEGPDFDEEAAGVVLGKAAEGANRCKKAGGPTGKGRVRVLYQPNGKAQKVVVSPPFHQTQVGECLVDHFRKTEVPAFGGQPVIVNKTFELE